MKRWKFDEAVPEEAYEALSDFPRFLAGMLWRREIRTKGDAERFLNPDWERDVHDPFLFRDMQKAVDRILLAAKEKERIIIHGDYDADGISGSVILSAALSAIGAEYDVFLPHREEDGYGMNIPAIEKMAKDGTKLIITTDCGISNAKEIAHASSLGIDTIITDHHKPKGDLPKAYAILHPLIEGETYPFRWLTGGGVAFKLSQALWRAAGLDEGHDKWLLDMVAISTVADMGDLKDENRALVHYGLLVMNKTKRFGLQKLIQATRRRDGETLNAETIGYQIAPRINAAGRMDHARISYDLLVAEDEGTADPLVAQLEKLNLARRAETDRMMIEARPLAAEQASRHGLVVVGNDDWMTSICGLVATRIGDKYHRPTIVLTKNVKGEYVGSGRSISTFDITSALGELEDLLVKFGGHDAACGMTVASDVVEEFAEAFRSLADRKLEKEDLEPFILIEDKLSLADISMQTMELLGRLEPFGMGNRKPKFLLEKVKIDMARRVGSDGKHLQLQVSDGGGKKLKLIAFGAGDREEEFPVGSFGDFIVELTVNEWKGYRSPQGMVVDLRPSLIKEKV